MSSRNHHLTWTVRTVLSIAAAGFALDANAADPPESDASIPTVRISALALDEDANNISSSFSILEGPELFARSQATLGDTLDGLPGVRSDTFGGGATRPVIRGQTAPRIKVLADGTSLLDASDISPDHAVTTEPLLLEKVEVLRGPATLLYGSGAIGGVVNVLDRRVPSELPRNRFEGSVGLRGATVSRERAGVLELTGRATEHLVFHIEGMARDADDYRVPRFTERRVPGTHTESGNASAGLSWISERGYIGLAYSYRDDDYGVPGHSHEYESCHPHDSLLHCEGHGEEEGGDEHDDAVVPTVALLSKRFDLRGELRAPLSGLERVRFRVSHTDYQHEELEENVPLTTFSNDGYEARVEVQHAPLGRWRGAIGAQYADTEISVLGEEAFIPTTQSESLGLFVVEHFELNDAWHFEAGVRHEWLDYTPRNDPRARPKFSDSTTSASAAAIWEFVPDYFLTLSVARSERSPHAQELYARGIHLATNTYECGLIPHPATCGGLENNADIRTETSNNVEVSLRRNAGRITFDVGAFHNEVDDYIHARTLDQFGNFRLIKYTQRDARLTGVEAEATWRLRDTLSATLFGDFVRARFKEGGNLPRIPAARYGARVNTSLGRLGGELEYYHVSDQDDIADYEVRTPGYDMVNFTITYNTPGDTGYGVFIRGTNLLDERVWNAASFLANVVPLPGRSVSAGIRLSF